MQPRLAAAKAEGPRHAGKACYYVWGPLKAGQTQLARAAPCTMYHKPQIVCVPSSMSCRAHEETRK
jgi:hypothetical protein